jgi:hypothetical protein
MNPFIQPLPDTVESRLKAICTPDEEAVIQVASDLSAGGLFEAQWLVVTKKRLFLIPFSGADVELALEDVEEVQV